MQQGATVQWLVGWFNIYIDGVVRVRDECENIRLELSVWFRVISW